MINSLHPSSKALLNALIGNDQSDRGTDESIFLQLEAFLDQKDATLDPSPELNSILSRMVALLQGCSCSSVEAFEDCLFSEVQQDVCREIDRSKILQTRVEFIRDLAMKAEFHLELHHVKRMLLKKGLNLS